MVNRNVAMGGKRSEQQEQLIALLRDRLISALQQARTGELAQGTGAEAIKRVFAKAKLNR